MNEYTQGRAVFKRAIIEGIRDALKAELRAEDPQLVMGETVTFPDQDDVDAGVALPVDGIHVARDPRDPTAWLVTVKIPRHSLPDNEAIMLMRIED